MHKKPVGRPRIPEEKKVKSVYKCITFDEDAYNKLESMKSDDESVSLFVNNLIHEKYLDC